MSDESNPAWIELANVLQTRRNLQSALVPAEVIGSLDFKKRYESETEFESRCQAARRYHAEHSAAFLESMGLKSEVRAREKITALKAREAELWHLVRPDLYAKPVASCTTAGCVQWCE